MESKSYLCPRFKKVVKSTSCLTRNVNTYKIPFTLPTCQSSNSASILEYNTTNDLDFLSDNSEKNIS